jgi:hypothetical protein
LSKHLLFIHYYGGDKLNTNNFDRPCNTILENIKRIDKAQKKAVIEDTTSCITCETSLLTTAYNTIPIALSTCCGTRITGVIDLAGETTIYFRIEAIRCCRYVTVRLLEEIVVDEVPTLIETPFTMVIDLDCVGTMQCFAPISITLCTDSTAMNDTDEN